jgi:hypothetical protein
MGDLQAIVLQLQQMAADNRKMAADNEAYRQEQARLREYDKREEAKQRLLDREYLDQRLFSMETSFSQQLADVTNTLAASVSTISSQSSKRSREHFELANADPDIEHNDPGRAMFQLGLEHHSDEDGDDWHAGQPTWAFEAVGTELVATSDPPPSGTLQHSQLHSHANALSDMVSGAVMKVLPSDNPKQCLLCGEPFKYKRFGHTFALTSLHI